MTGSGKQAGLASQTNNGGALQQAVNPAVILLGTDTPIGLAVMRDLGRHGYRVIGLGRSPVSIGSASKYCTHHVVRQSEETELVEQIESLATKYGAFFLLAISEPDLLLINRNRQRLEKTLQPLTPPADKLLQVLDKVICQNHAKDVGIRTPTTISPTSLEQIEEISSQLPYPAILKWAEPNAVAKALADKGLPLHKVQFAHNASELLVKLKPYDAIGQFPMIQEYCHGHGIGHMFLAKEGEILIEFQHERIHEWPPEGGVSSLCRSIPLSRHTEARKKSRQLLQKLRWTGVAMVEYRYDPTSQSWCFLEINGRFWGSLPLAIRAGIPFASGLVAAIGENSRVPDYSSNFGQVSCLFWIPETKRVLRLLFQRGRIEDPFISFNRTAEIIQYFRYILDPRTRFYIFSWQDSGPFLADAKALAGKIWRSVFWS